MAVWAGLLWVFSAAPSVSEYGGGAAKALNVLVMLALM